MPVITLVNEGKTFDAPVDANLRKVLIKNGISPYAGKDKLLNCLGNGLCGTCRVEVVDGKGASPIMPMEDAALVGLAPFYARLIPKNVRLSCRINITGDMSIKTYPTVTLDKKLTRERLSIAAMWLFFGGSFLAVMGRLLFELATGR